MKYNEFTNLVYPLEQFRKEHEKECFFAERAEELRFDYDSRTSIVILSEWGARLLGTDKTVHNMLENHLEVMNEPHVKTLSEHFRSASADAPDVEEDVELIINDELMSGKLSARTLWSDDEVPGYTGVFGKITELKPVENHRKP